jgi:ribonuclease BN (tRNA processing enzyme)
MRYAIQNNKVPAIPLYLPASPGNMYELFRDEKAFQTAVITEGTQLRVKEAVLTFQKMTHSVDSFAVRIACEGGALVYSGDTNMNGGLAGFALGADALLCDAAFSSETLPANPPHLSSAQAAGIAREAGVRKLYLTHISPEQDESVLLGQAKAIFENSEITVENHTVTI